MVTHDEAVSRAREWLASGSTTPADAAIDVYEFDSGYVVWPRVANPAGGRGMPDLGGARAVVDRDSGELTTWPMLPPETIAQRYTVDRQARRRFPPDVFTGLRMAGWRPGRNVDAAVTLWLDRADIERVLPIFPPARAALREFGGLTVAQRGPTGLPGKGWTSSFYPGQQGPTTAEIVDFGRTIGAAVFPIGDNDDGPSHIVMDASARVFLLHPIKAFYLGASMDEALVWVTRGGDRPVVDDHGVW